MDEAARRRQQFGLFFVGLALGYLAARRFHRTTHIDIADYQGKVREARQTANALRWEQSQRGGNHGSKQRSAQL